MKGLLLLLFSILLAISLRAQHEEVPGHVPDYLEQNEMHNRIGLFTGTSLVPTHLGHDVSKDVLFVPTYGLEYERLIFDWLAVGIENEIELQHYVIVDEENHQINRNNIYLVTGLVFIRPFSDFEIFGGAGHEFTGNQNFTVIKFGISYVFRINEEWDLSPVVSLDMVGNLYTVETFGLSIGYRFK